MFETVAPDAFVRRDRHIFYESLPVSVALHAIATGAVAVVIASHVTLPLEPPKLIVGYLAAELGQPVPPPPSLTVKRPDAPKPKLAAPVQLAPMELAPTTIPDEVAEMPLPSPIRRISANVEKFVPAAGVAGGVAGGAAEGVAGGIVGGDGRMHFERDSRLPLYMEAHPYPRYPASCIEGHKEGIVIVKYVIGKNGRVSEASIIHHAALKEFDEAAIEAVRNWTFRPFIIDGEPMEVVHELTVYFRLY